MSRIAFAAGAPHCCFMELLVLCVDGETGLMFAGLLDETVAFVPTYCILAAPNRGVFIDECLYIVSGWAEKNMLFSPIGCGARLLPRDDQPLCDANDPRVESFIEQARLSFDVQVRSVNSSTPAAAFAPVAASEGPTFQPSHSRNLTPLAGSDDSSIQYARCGSDNSAGGIDGQLHDRLLLSSYLLDSV